MGATRRHPGPTATSAHPLILLGGYTDPGGNIIGGGLADTWNYGP